jgi:hypothetical protein
MHTATDYRKFAQECMDSARSANSDAVRNQFLELAQLWLTAAARLELHKADGHTTWEGLDQPSQGSSDSS